jgi:hypothetical protein
MCDAVSRSMDLHRPVATWTLPHCSLSIIDHWRRRRLAGETISTNGQQCGALPIGEPTEVANARKSLGQHMLGKASQELFIRQRKRALLVVMGIVLPAEAHLVSSTESNR